MKFISVFLFFVTFYKISFLHPNLYLTFFFTMFGSLVLLKYNKIFVSCVGIKVIYSFFLILFFSLAVDLVTGALVSNFSNSFTVRALSLIFISAIPAFFLVVSLLKFNYKSTIDIIVVAFWIQSVFWLITFLEPSTKFLITGFMGGGDNAVNLRDHNLNVRGFGISSEINFTTPFVTVLVCLLLVKKNAISVVSTFMQLINSNLVLIAILIGASFSKMSLIRKCLSVLIVSFLFFIVYQLGDEYFPRLFAEFSSGESRTINALINQHVLFLNEGLWGHLFGEGIYVFQGGFSFSSDIGWIHIYNYGGIFFTVLYVLFLLFLSFSAFGRGSLGLAWFGSGVVLNAKGLLFSPNAFFFVTFIFIFLNYDKKLKLRSQ